MSDKVIHGCAQTGEVWIGDTKLDINRSLQLENKSPSGFAWGYRPADHATALCSRALACYPFSGDRKSERINHGFK